MSHMELSQPLVRLAGSEIGPEFKSSLLSWPRKRGQSGGNKGLAVLSCGRPSPSAPAAETWPPSNWRPRRLQGQRGVQPTSGLCS